MSRFPHFPREISLMSMPSRTHYTSTAISMRTAHGCFRAHTARTSLTLQQEPPSPSSGDLGNGAAPPPVALALACICPPALECTHSSSRRAHESACLSVLGQTASLGPGTHDVPWEPPQRSMPRPPGPRSVPLWLTKCTASVTSDKQNVSLSLSCLKFSIGSPLPLG